MEIIDNITTLLGDNLKKTLRPDSKLKVAASCFSIYTYEALKKELEQSIHSMIDIKEDKDLDNLFTGGGTTALLNTISGLNDFELIAFLVVRA